MIRLSPESNQITTAPILNSLGKTPIPTQSQALSFKGMQYYLQTEVTNLYAVFGTRLAAIA